MARLATTSLLLSFGLVTLLSVHLTEAAATIQIVTPSDQGFVNSGGGSPAPVEVTYQVTGNTYTHGYDDDDNLTVRSTTSTL